MAHLSDEVLRASIEAASTSRTIQEAADKVGVSRTTMRDRLRVARQRGMAASFATPKRGESMSVEQSGDTAYAESVSSHRKTPEEVFAASGMDPAVWTISKAVVNHYGADNPDGDDQTYYQCKVWLARTVPEKLTGALDLIEQRLSKYRPSKVRTERHLSGDVLLEIGLVDHHFGKLAWSKETGEDYDLEIAESTFLDAVTDTLERVSHLSVDNILLPIGQDFFNIDGWKGETFNGTPQDNDGRWPKVFTVGFMACLKAVDALRQRAPVSILWVPGNHDWTASYHLCHSLWSYYQGQGAKDVTVDVSPSPRKYHRYGCTLLGFTHGNEERHTALPGIMAMERPHAWAQTTDREWHIGHYHARKATTHTPISTHEGVTVRVLPSMTGRDAWHHKKGYVGGKRSCESYLWHRHEGYYGHVVTNVRSREKCA